MGSNDGTEKADCPRATATFTEFHQAFAVGICELLTNVVNRKDAAVIGPRGGVQEANDLKIAPQIAETVERFANDVPV